MFTNFEFCHEIIIEPYDIEPVVVGRQIGRPGNFPDGPGPKSAKSGRGPTVVEKWPTWFRLTGVLLTIKNQLLVIKKNLKFTINNNNLKFNNISRRIV